MALLLFCTVLKTVNTDFFFEFDCSFWISMSDVFEDDDFALEAVDFQPSFLPIAVPEVDLDLLAAE